MSAPETVTMGDLVLGTVTRDDSGDTPIAPYIAETVQGHRMRFPSAREANLWLAGKGMDCRP